MIVRPNPSGEAEIDSSLGPLFEPAEADRAVTLTEAYAQYWLLPESAAIEDYQQLLRDIAALETTLPPATVTTTLQTAATEFHATTGYCPFCRQRGPLHTLDLDVLQLPEIPGTA